MSSIVIDAKNNHPVYPDTYLHAHTLVFYKMFSVFLKRFPEYTLLHFQSDCA